MFMSKICGNCDRYQECRLANRDIQFEMGGTCWCPIGVICVQEERDEK